MKLNSRTLVLACLAVFGLFAVSTPAQDQNLRNRLPDPKIHAPKADDASVKELQHGSNVHSEADTCAHTFTNAGANNSYMEFCVTADGNILSFQSPTGIEYLNLGQLVEGYGICDFNTATRYYDFSDYGISSNWNPPTLVTSNATMVKIARSTSDGAWTLTQTITKLAGATPYAKISMALKNNSSVEKDVYLLRWADVDPYNATATANFQESFDSTINAAWGYTDLVYSGPDSAGFGLMLLNIGIPLPASVPSAWSGYNLDTNLPPADVCDPAATYSGGFAPLLDGSVEMLYFMELKKGQVGTVNSRYQAF